MTDELGSGMVWNYRIVRTPVEHDPGKFRFAIHEVFYSKDVPTAYTEDPVAPEGETLVELMGDLEHYQAATEKPVLDYRDLP